MYSKLDGGSPQSKLREIHDCLKSNIIENVSLVNRLETSSERVGNSRREATLRI